MTDTITLPRSVVEQALAAFEQLVRQHYRLGTEFDDRAKALRTALEQPQVEQEPVAEVIESHVRAGLNGQFTAVVAGRERLSVNAELFVHPHPPRQPLTDEHIQVLADLYMEAFAQFVGAGEVWFEGEKDFARAIERAHGIGGEA